MLRAINPLGVVLFTGFAGIAMMVAGHEIGGAICLSGACITFALVHWLSKNDDDEESILVQEDDAPSEHLEDLAIQSDISYRRMRDDEDRAWRTFSGNNGSR